MSSKKLKTDNELPRTADGLRAALKRLVKLSGVPRVTDLYYMMDVDGYGEEYLAVYAILDDRDADPVPLPSQLARIEEVIREEMKRLSNYWVLTSFRSQSEQQREMKRRDAIVKPSHVSAA